MTIHNSNKKIRLGVNIDHVATIRQARFTNYPDPTESANLAEKGGADGITIHIREDRRHIQEQDLYNLQQDKPNRYINLEMAVTTEMLEMALKYKPQACCIVPEKREELTTEGGLNVIDNQQKITEYVQKLESSGIEVSLFIDPDKQQIKAAHQCGVKVIEIHTGDFCNYPYPSTETMSRLQTIKKAVIQSQQLGLKVNAGHGLNYDNVVAINDIEGIYELNIGHAIIARALMVGMTQAVQEMRDLIS